MENHDPDSPKSKSLNSISTFAVNIGWIYSIKLLIESFFSLEGFSNCGDFYRINKIDFSIPSFLHTFDRSYRICTAFFCLQWFRQSRKGRIDYDAKNPDKKNFIGLLPEMIFIGSLISPAAQTRVPDSIFLNSKNETISCRKSREKFPVLYRMTMQSLWKSESDILLRVTGDQVFPFFFKISSKSTSKKRIDSLMSYIWWTLLGKS